MWPFPEGIQGGHLFPPQYQQGYGGPRQIEASPSPNSGPGVLMRSQQQEHGFGLGQQRQGMQSHDPDRFSRPTDSLIHFNHQQETPSNSGPLGDVRLTTSAYHYEPKVDPKMSETQFALAIINDYITAWSKFTQASIARHLRAIKENHPESQLIEKYDISERRKYLEEMLPRQLEEMTRQVNYEGEVKGRQIVDWIRKEKMWERSHGWDPELDGSRKKPDYSHLLPWMEGAKVNPASSNNNSNNSNGQGFGNAMGGGPIWDRSEYGSWGFTNSSDF